MSINKGFGRINGSWNQIDGCYIKQNGLWVKHPSVHVKRGGDWYKVTFAQLPPDVICVSPFGDGDGTGSNWSNAMSFRQFTVRASLTEDTVYFFKKGCYALNLDIPTTGDFENYIYKGTPVVYGSYNETAPIQLANNISIYGGFEGNDAEPMKRHGMFAGTENRTVFFKMYKGSGGITSLFKRPLSNGSSKATIDNVDLRGYNTSCDLFKSDTFPGTTAVDHNISRVSSNGHLMSGLTFSTSAEPAPRSNITFDSCIAFGNPSYIAFPILEAKNTVLSLINCYMASSGLGQICGNFKVVSQAARDVCKSYIINSTILRYKTTTPCLFNTSYTSYGKSSDSLAYVIPDLINSIDLNVYGDGTSTIYKNGVYLDYWYNSKSGNKEYYDNGINSLSHRAGTTSAGMAYVLNQAGIGLTKSWGTLLPNAGSTITAFLSNEDAFAYIAGYSVALSPMSALTYPKGSVVDSANNISVPTVDITGYSRPSDVMTLGAWTYR